MIFFEYFIGLTRLKNLRIFKIYYTKSKDKIRNSMKITLISVKYASVTAICFRRKRKLERTALREEIDLNRTNVRPSKVDSWNSV